MQNGGDDRLWVDDSDSDSLSSSSDSDCSSWSSSSDSDSDDDSESDSDTMAGLRGLRPTDPREFSMFAHLAIFCNPMAGEAVCAYLHTTPDVEKTPCAYDLQGLARDMLSALPPRITDDASLRLDFTGNGREDVLAFFERLDRIADAHRRERERLHASDHTLAIGEVFSAWPVPHRGKEHDDAAPLSYLLVTGKVKQKKTAALFAIRFGPDSAESSRLVAKVGQDTCAPTLDPDAAGPFLAPYVGVVPTLLETLLADSDALPGDPCLPPNLVTGAIAGSLGHAKPATLPPQAYAAIWPSASLQYPTHYWPDEQDIKAAWLTQNQLCVALGAIVAYEAAETVGLDVPRYGRTDPLGAASLCDKGRHLEGLGLLRSDGTGPLSLLQTAQVRIVESAWRAPLVDLPDDIAAPLALALWRRACMAPRAKDGTIANAQCLLDVAHYWGVRPTKTHEERPEWLCQDLMTEAVARAASLGTHHAVPVAWEDTFRPSFPSRREHETMWRIEMASIEWIAETDDDGDIWGDGYSYSGRGRNCCSETDDQLRAHVTKAFARVYQRQPRVPDEPLIANAVDLTIRARAKGGGAASRTATSAKERATIALSVVRAHIGVDASQLSDTSMFPKRLCDAFRRLPSATDVPLRWNRPDADSKDASVNGQSPPRNLS
ncbi:hypothetical protein psal_cds_824 [Pandoravirus salinus]|uniref:Uncharacterized protein n=1 Tax=Pandoravirus salinus TaxID=1349410 RepID=S4VW32_9VIRU|nr:hypothetical protein psal_cds_824 [Pandoravirus salinus]AGO84859.1 hypothetical protein psal_cds_824 [Pandoravirus salinus]